MRFFDMIMTLVLSHLMGTCNNVKPKSLSVCFIQRTCAHPNPMTMYSAFDVDYATEFCFLPYQDTSE